MNATTVPSKYCVFEYLYRDAANYKAYGAILLSGDLTSRHREQIARSLIDGVYFTPAKCGLSPLHDELFQHSNGPTEDDLPWHEFVCLRAASAEDFERLSVCEDIDAFVTRFGH